MVPLKQTIEVRGGGFHLRTADPFLIAAVRRCAELEAELTKARHEEVARYRTLRRDVSDTKRATRRIAKTLDDRKP